MPINVEVILSAKDQATSALKRFGASVGSVQSSFERIKGPALLLGGALTAAAGAAVAFGVASVKAASQAQVKIAAMDATLKATGKSSVKVRSQILKSADSFTKLGFDNEEAAKQMAFLFQRTGDVTKAMNLTALAADLARAKNIGLEDATRLVAMAMSGSGRALLQYGIKIKDTATPLEALGILQKKVGGQAEAFAATFQGQVEVFNEVFGNLKEDVGAIFLPILTDLLKNLSPIVEKISTFVKNTDNLKAAWERAKPIISTVATIFALTFGPAIATLAVNFGIAQVRAAALTAINFAKFAASGWVAVAPWLALAAKATLLIGLFFAIAELTERILTGGKRSFVGEFNQILHDLKIPGFAMGGTVPGPIGRPQLIVAHGGEEISPVGKHAGGVVNQTLNFYGISTLFDVELALERVGARARRGF